MTKNPIINALGAFGYIILVVSIINFLSGKFKNTPDTILAPIFMISLFTLSAAIMGYIFLSLPLQLFLEGRKKDAISLFLKTVATFAGITALVLTAVIFGLSPKLF